MNTWFRLLASLLALALVSCTTNQQGHLAADRFGDLSLGPAPRAAFAARFDRQCGASGLTPAGADAFRRAPYLQQVTATAAVVAWTTDAAASCEVRAVGPDGAATLAAAADDDGGLRLARLEALAPDTTYCYSVVCGGETWLSPTGFRTAPEAGQGAPVRLVVMGDVGTGDADALAVRDQVRTVDFDLALVTGDVGFPDGTTAQLERGWFGVYGDVLRHVPAFPAAGNHDYNTADAEPLRQAFVLPENGGAAGRERWYSFDWGDAHVVVLDTQQLGAEQTAWLEQDLAANRRPWTIVVGHHPPYSSGTHGPNEDVQTAIVPLLERFRVPLALFGHDHSYERTHALQGVTYLVTGGGGVGTRPVGASAFTAFSLQVAHFVYLEIDGPVLRAWAIDATGREFDSVLLTLPG